MIITRTPFRVSFAGGGTDIPEFYREYGPGAVISAAIKQYMYIAIHPYFHDKIRIKYSRTEDVDTIDEIQHPVFRECLKRLEVEKGVEIASFADIASGTGLGSSSSFTVGLLNALYAFKGKMVSKNDLAAQACEIEIDVLKEPIGKQDQYAAAFGGLNHIRFNRDESVEVSPVVMNAESINTLEENLRLYSVGGSRQAREILQEQQSNIQSNKDVIKNLCDMRNQVDQMQTALSLGQVDLVGKILDKGWQKKRTLASGITNTTIDTLYETARLSGSKGGKLLGAGGTGFLLLGHENHLYLKKQMNCKSLPFEIDREGSKVLFYE
jgi:D-glycero-alpha-D-manno-heptose-7-phosphate kinase